MPDETKVPRILDVLQRASANSASAWPLLTSERRVLTAGAIDDLKQLESDLASVTYERDTLASEPEFRCPECGSFDVSEYIYKDDFASMECNACRYRGQPGEDFPSATRLIAIAKERGYLRPEVRAFARIMEQELREHDAKRGDDWKHTHSLDLVGRVHQEYYELCHSVEDGWGPQGIASNAADVANMAMMVADVCGGLPEEAPGEEVHDG